MPGVYISYPFCTQKCSFCNFASGVATDVRKEAYAKILLEEIRAHHWSWEPETLYFGGGTPSLMPIPLLKEIFSAMPGTALQETTLECAPGSLTPDKVHDWVKLGVNRVSLGVQSFVTTELRQTGRRHDAALVTSDISLLRDCGIDNFNVDLIAGLPGQTCASWAESLAWIERLHPPHVSVYLFEVDEDSRLGKEVLLGGTRYGAALLPIEEIAAELYEMAVERLSSLDIQRYEISNFATPGKESAHNLKYWKLEPYVGFGLDAASFNGSVRSSNPDTLEAYLQLQPTDPVASNLEEEHFFVGLRLASGIQPTAAEWERFSEPIARWVNAGMLVKAGATLRLSGRGVLLSNEILADFI